jgi:hypothetical protein
VVITIITMIITRAPSLGMYQQNQTRAFSSQGSQVFVASDVLFLFHPLRDS